ERKVEGELGCPDKCFFSLIRLPQIDEDKAFAEPREDMTGVKRKCDVKCLECDPVRTIPAVHDRLVIPSGSKPRIQGDRLLERFERLPVPVHLVENHAPVVPGSRGMRAPSYRCITGCKFLIEEIH